MNIEKVKAFIQKYRFWIIWGLIVLVASAIVVMLILNARKNNQPSVTSLIETPLVGGTSHTVIINKNIINDSDFPKSLDVFNLVDKNYNTTIDKFLTLLGKSSLNKTSTQTVLYTWIKGEDYVEYIPNLQSLTFSFSTPVNTGLGITVEDDESARNFLESLYRRFLSREYTFTNVNIDTSATRITIEANREVNGYPLYTRGSNEYSDMIVITKDGKLVSGTLLLMEYDQDKSESISLVDISNLQAAMADAQYPKEIFQGFTPGTVENQKGEGPVEIDGTLYGDVTELSANFPKASSSSVDKAQLVYLFSDMSLQQLSPSYRLKSTGFVLFNGKTVEVPIVIFANALDPDRVYVSD